MSRNSRKNPKNEIVKAAGTSVAKKEMSLAEKAKEANKKQANLLNTANENPITAKDDIITEIKETLEPQTPVEPKEATKAETPIAETKEVTKTETPIAETKEIAKAETPAAEIKETAKAETKKTVTEKSTTKVKTIKSEKERPNIKQKHSAKVEKATAKVKEIDEDEEFNLRMAQHKDELEWLYMELYNTRSHLDELEKNIYNIYKYRKKELKDIDRKRVKDPDWYKRNNLIGMMLYVDLFAENLEGIEQKLDYLQQNNVNYLHLMPLLKSPYGKSDGGYAVSDFRTVQENLGTIEQLAELADKCHQRGINICLDFVINHTSDEHEWALRAKQCDPEYMSRYFFFDNYDIPSQYERTVPQVFPNTAPGNFTYLQDIHKYVMTTFNNYQWDLNYRNPVVFNEMVYNLLFLANEGVDILRIDAVPYIWKQLDTTCRNLPQVHTIMRLIRIISEIVCPGILLNGEVVMSPDKVAPYFGTVEKPECHLLYNVTTMACTWNSLATRDTRLLKNQINMLGSLPSKYTFLNYLRCHDDIGWGLDEDALRYFGIDPGVNKKYLNDFYSGVVSNSFARGELYNCDIVTKDARICGTTASLCGLEKAIFEADKEQIEISIKRDIMLHAFIFTISGIPVIYSGDEIGQLNDYSYKDDFSKALDSRYLHRGKFDWDKAKNIKDKKSIQYKIYSALKNLEDIRVSHDIFDGNVNIYAIETQDISVLGLIRRLDKKRLLALFNFSEDTKTVSIEQGEDYTNLLTNKKTDADEITLEPYEFLWLQK